MPTRRQFLKTAALGSLGLTSLPFRAVRSARGATGHFSVHPFIERHPEAVFIMPTRVAHKMDEEAKRRAGRAFGKSVFVPADDRGVPVTASIPVKMNLKTTGADRFPVEQIIGTVADFYFAEGVFESLQALGVPGSHIHLRENPRGKNSFEIYGIVDMANRCGIDFRQNFASGVGDGLVEGRDYNWVDVPDGRWFKKIPQIEPINTPGSWLLNISKFKTHGMGMTLCAKNLQGIIARPYTRLCATADSELGIGEVMHGNAVDAIRRSYIRHRDDNRIPRWDRPGERGGIWQEAWSQRTLDHISVTPSGLAIIEGIYGRDGDCGNNGPHPLNGGGVDDGTPRVTARDYMSNMIIFGKDVFRTDIVGHWLGGHEPGNFGYFHLAIERGLSDALDPRKIPVYLWNDGEATLAPLDSFTRTPLLTYYLQRDYSGWNEPKYHMVDEPFDYSTVDGVAETPRPAKPEVVALDETLLQPSDPRVPIEYRLPLSGFVRLEITDQAGKTDVLADGYRLAGAHLASWRAAGRPSGDYAYRLRINGAETAGTVRIRL